MLFNSLQYIVFLPLVLLFFWCAPARFRPSLLLIGSYVFYASWNPIYLLLIIGMTFGNWLMGFLIAATSMSGLKKFWLILAIVGNVGLLGYFKYTNFFLKLGYDALNLFHLPHSEIFTNVILPLGISFFTFEFLHYLIEVYRGHPPVKNFIIFAVFAGFFPTQIAGPIKRYQDFVPQIENHPGFDLNKFNDGFVLVLHGLAKKVLLADNLATFVNLIYAQPYAYSNLELWLATYAFAFQVYCDFSGYTDIAIGSSLMLGITVPPNFNVPYMANNIRELWHRQHISLSQWFRDYVYFPLGGSRTSTLNVYRNLLLTTGLAGLWHGAAMHFVFWGLFQGLSLIVHREWMRLYGKVDWLGNMVKTKWWNIVAILITFHAFCVSYVFFRAETIPEAFGIIGRMFQLWDLVPHEHLKILTSKAPLIVPLVPFVLAGLVIAHIIAELAKRDNFFHKSPRWLQAAYCSFLIFLMLALLPDQANRFLYFQF
jgi:alginate O-acetyltransferase complex protein AlgI